MLPTGAGAGFGPSMLGLVVDAMADDVVDAVVDIMVPLVVAESTGLAGGAICTVLGDRVLPVVVVAELLPVLS